jgi:hypothetical protein
VVDEGKAVIPLNISVVGDITVVTYHARSTFGGKVYTLNLNKNFLTAPILKTGLVERRKNIVSRVKPVLRGHPWDKEKVVF